LHLRLLPMAALLFCAACAKPADVAVQFHDALAADNGARAFSFLSARSQAELTRIAKAAHEKSGGAVSEDPAAMIVRGDASIYPLPTQPGLHAVHATLLSTNGPRAKVAVQIGEKKHEMDLVREGGRWKIDLPLGSP
jgi:hypothetical protein